MTSHGGDARDKGGSRVECAGLGWQSLQDRGEKAHCELTESHHPDRLLDRLEQNPANVSPDPLLFAID